MNWDAPLGYKFAVVDAGFRKPAREDLALVISEVPALAAATFTANVFCAAPVLVGREILSRREYVRGVLINSGQANASTGTEGERACRESLRLAAKELSLETDDLLPASTGVIGSPLDLDLWSRAAPKLASGVGGHGAEDFARAIMTTDRFPKLVRAEARLSGGMARICGIAKGAGMICPNMATMLAVLLCDIEIAPDLWRGLVREAVEQSFNRVSVDGDTSTNDTLYALANGAGGVRAEKSEAGEFGRIMAGVLGKLAYMLVEDGEGGTKVLHIRVSGARDALEAEKAARTIGHSPLVKTAIYGEDANWGRIIAALGRSGADFRPEEAALSLGGVELFSGGRPRLSEDIPELKRIMAGKDIHAHISLGSGTGEYTLLVSDLTHQYVDINAKYRT